MSKLSRVQNHALPVLVLHGTKSVAVLHAKSHGENPVKGFSHLVACGIRFVHVNEHMCMKPHDHHHCDDLVLHLSMFVCGFYSCFT